MTIDLKTGKVDRWQTPFFDALDQCGIVYERDSYYAQNDKKKRGKQKFNVL